MGYGEQLAQQAPPQSEQQKKAAAICTQSQKIKALIEDLNLTFKLQYNAQPLRRTAVPMGAWLRQSVADFCDSLGENYSVGLQIREPAGQTVLEADRELLTRALDNLLNNSVRHNPGGCDIQVAAELADGRFVLTVRGIRKRFFGIFPARMTPTRPTFWGCIWCSRLPRHMREKRASVTMAALWRH